MLKVATVCSGIGSPEMALQNLGIEHSISFACEIDKYARETYLANYEPKMMLQDMTAENWEGSEYYADLFIGGIPCFKAGTLITTSNGLKPIEEIQKDDMVLTHKNRFRKVVIPMVKKSDTIFDIKIQGSPLISATSEHPFYVRTMSRKWNNERRCDERVFSEPEWIDAKDLKPKFHFVGFGMNTENRNDNNLTEEECWYLGRYMADGYITSRGLRETGKERKLYKTTLCVGKSKIDDFFDFKEIKATPSKERTVIKFHTYNKRLHTLCSYIGKGAENKEIPTFILNLPVYMLKIFIDGYLSGDGSVKDGKYSATTVSKKLAYSLSQAVFKCYKTPCSITFCKRPPTCVIEGRIVNQRDTYQVNFCKEIRKQNNAVSIDGVVWQPVRSLNERIHDDYVYNFEVEEDNSYVAENCIVHNCQAFSLAGKRLGELDSRGLLFYDFYKYVKVQNPKYFIIENVKGLLSDNSGRTFQNWQDLLGQSVNGLSFVFPHEDSLMYNLHWQVLNTKDYGLPQNRERVFLIGIRKDLPNDFNFPKPIPLKLRLKDVLETEVDEKYYLSEKLISGFARKPSIENFPFKPLGEGDDICPTITARIAKCSSSDPYIKCVGNTNPSGIGMNGEVFHENGISPTLTTNKGEGIKIMIPEATKKGYAEATIGDSINLSNMGSETRRGRVGKGIAQTLDTACNQAVVEPFCVAMRGRKNEDGKYIQEFEPSILKFERTEQAKSDRRKTGTNNFQDKQIKLDNSGISNTLTSVQKDNLIVEPKVIQVSECKKSGGVQPYQQDRVYDSEGIAPALMRCKSDLNIVEPTIIQLNNPTHSNDRIYSSEGLSPTLNTMQGGNRQPFIKNDYRIRKLTPLETMRLQGFPDDFKRPCSASQQYKMSGNSISVPVIQAILKNLLK